MANKLPKICQNCISKPISNDAKYCRCGILLSLKKKRCKYKASLLSVHPKVIAFNLRRILDGSARIKQADSLYIIKAAEMLEELTEENGKWTLLKPTQKSQRQ